MPTLVAALACAAASCAVKSRRTPDDTVVVLIEDAIRDVDPRFAMTNYDTKVSRLVVPGLTTTDRPNMEPALEMAESIEQLDDVTWDAVLKPGLVFSDGTPVTSEDVVYTYMSTLDADFGSVHRTGFEERFRSVEAIDERTTRFHLIQPVATLLSDMEFGIVSKAAAEEGGGRFPDGRVIGAGPYRIASYHTEKVVLERNPNYYGEPPRMPRVIIRTVRDSNARALMLVGGSADLVQNSVRLDLVDDIAARERVVVETGPGAILTYLMMNNDDPALSDVRVRRAIAYAIDRQKLIDVKLGGRAVLATGLIPPIHWAYNPNVRRYDYDPDRARALLDEAGFPDPDGPGGEPRMRLTYKTSANQFRVALARIIAAQLGEVGIDVEVRAFEFGTFFMDVKKGNYQLGSMQTSPITDPDWTYTYYNSSRIPTPENLHEHNRWRYRNARVDELTEAGRRESNRDKRLRIYAEVQEILASELPVVPLWHEDNIAVMNVDLEGYEILPNARFRGLTRVFKRK